MYEWLRFTIFFFHNRLRDQVATCPNCRVEISKSTASRNLAVEKAVSELPNECQFCGKEYPSKSLERHEKNECDERPTNCKYQRIGCQWKGPVHEGINLDSWSLLLLLYIGYDCYNLIKKPFHFIDKIASEHENNCLHPKKTGAEVMLALQANEVDQSEEKKIFSALIELLSYEKILFNGNWEYPSKWKIVGKSTIQIKTNNEFSIFLDLQLKPYRTDEYVHKLFYETSRFGAFNHQWVVKARINNSQRDPHTVNDRQITYQVRLIDPHRTHQAIVHRHHNGHSIFIHNISISFCLQLILKTKTSSPLPMHFIALKGPFYDMKVKTLIYKHEFTDQENESEYFWLPLPDSSECNRLLASKAINIRLIMFLLSK